MIKSIAGVEDLTGAAFFASALSTGTAGTARTAGGASDPRHPTLVLPADPTASARKPTPTPGASVTSVHPREGSESTKHVRTPSGAFDPEQLAGGAASQSSKAALMNRASSAYLRQLHTGTVSITANAPSTAGPAAATADVQAPLSTEELLARSEELIRDMEALFASSTNPTSTAGTNGATVSQKASALSAAALNSTGSPALLARVREENILRQGASQVSREILSSASTGKASASWGGVEEIDGHGSVARYDCHYNPFCICRS